MKSLFASWHEVAKAGKLKEQEANLKQLKKILACWCQIVKAGALREQEAKLKQLKKLFVCWCQLVKVGALQKEDSKKVSFERSEQDRVKDLTKEAHGIDLGMLTDKYQRAIAQIGILNIRLIECLEKSQLWKDRIMEYMAMVEALCALMLSQLDECMKAHESQELLLKATRDLAATLRSDLDEESHTTHSDDKNLSRVAQSRSLTLMSELAHMSVECEQGKDMLQKQMCQCSQDFDEAQMRIDALTELLGEEMEQYCAQKISSRTGATRFNSMPAPVRGGRATVPGASSSQVAMMEGSLLRSRKGEIEAAFRTCTTIAEEIAAAQEGANLSAEK